MTTRDNSISAIAQLYRHIMTHGPIDTVRVSSAHARGRASKYPYWGAALYQIRVLASGWVGNVCVSGASSDRRSVAGAERDADATGRVICGYIGQLSEQQAEWVLAHL